MTSAAAAPAAYAAIQQVIAAYAVGIDARDFDRVAACFAEDAEATYAGVAVPGGREAIVEWLRANMAFVSSTHVFGEPLIELDGERARTVTLAVAFLVFDEGGQRELRTRGLRYTDELEWRGGAWKIVRRVHEALWEARQPAEAAPERPT